MSRQSKLGKSVIKDSQESKPMRKDSRKQNIISKKSTPVLVPENGGTVSVRNRPDYLSIIEDSMTRIVNAENRLETQKYLMNTYNLSLNSCRTVVNQSLTYLKRLNPKNMEQFKNVFFTRFEELYSKARLTDPYLALKILEAEGKFYGLNNPKEVRHTGNVTVEIDMGLIATATEEDDESEFEIWEGQPPLIGQEEDSVEN